METMMKEGTSLEAHIKHMKEVADRLAAIESPISGEGKRVTLLCNLPHSDCSRGSRS